MKPVVFLDRDGTIIEDKDYLKNPDETELLPGAAQALKLLQQNGFELIVVTNQSGIGRGYFTENDMHAVNARMCELLQAQGVTLSLRRIYHCPHTPQDNCTCRKPLTGMALSAQKDWLFDIKRGFVIGDKKSDLELARNLNLYAVLVKTGYGAKTAAQYPHLADYTTQDLADAASWIIAVSSPHC